jgi:hypothetical protein
MKKIESKNKKNKKNMQCVLCQANFEVWVSNERMPEEKLRSHFLSYCPACTRAGEK